MVQPVIFHKGVGDGPDVSFARIILKATIIEGRSVIDCISGSRVEVQSVTIRGVIFIWPVFQFTFRMKQKLEVIRLLFRISIHLSQIVFCVLNDQILKCFRIHSGKRQVFLISDRKIILGRIQIHAYITGRKHIIGIHT